MADWARNKAWADRYMRAVRCLLGDTFFREGTPEEDQQQNTDLRVFRLTSFTVAVRVRQHRYMSDPQHPEWKTEVTFRSSLPSGVPTEREKMLSGWGDYMVYAFAAEQGGGLARWVVLDLEHLRTCWACRARIENAGEKHNHDNSSDFVYVSTVLLCDKAIHRASPDWQQDLGLSA